MTPRNLQPPKNWRELLVALAVVLAVIGVIFAVWQPFSQRWEDECRAKCAASGQQYSYTGRNSCSCIRR